MPHRIGEKEEEGQKKSIKPARSPNPSHHDPLVVSDVCEGQIKANA